MIHWEDGLFLTRPRLAIDVRRRQPRAFVSHAHADHIARHEAAYCTPETAMLYQHRLGEHRRVVLMPYGEPRAYGDVQLTASPAGHCLGSAMLLVEGGEKSLLYTGDFKLGRSATAVEAELPRADVLVMECTFGRPRYRLPPREEVVDQLVALVRDTLRAGATPVVHAYPLGKGQEITRLLTAAGIAVLQHPDMFAISEIYRQCGVELGDVRRYDATLLEGRAVLTIPKGFGRFRLPGIDRVVSIAVTGWAREPSTRMRWQVDHALPLSDHADFDELLETARRVGAREIYCTHGPREFVEHLLSHGFHARPVEGPYQRRMF
ncbi:MAG: MBL fold metallo-hydrolase [Planctomycetota bacterium]